MKTLAAALLVFVGSLFGPLVQTAEAEIFFFEIQWSGSANGNSAVANAVVGIDTALIPNPGLYDDIEIMPEWVDSITLTVSGAEFGNGTFTLDDFGGVRWDTAGATLNFASQLVGQETDFEPWGTLPGPEDLSGDFNVFGLGDDAPNGTSYFQLTTYGGNGETMNLISFAPIPEPTTTALLVGGVAVACVLGRRRKSLPS